jgi:hypothetical protein
VNVPSTRAIGMALDALDAQLRATPGSSVVIWRRLMEARTELHVLRARFALDFPPIHTPSEMAALDTPPEKKC